MKIDRKKIEQCVFAFLMGFTLGLVLFHAFRISFPPQL